MSTERYQGNLRSYSSNRSVRPSPSPGKKSKWGVGALDDKAGSFAELRRSLAEQRKELKSLRGTLLRAMGRIRKLEEQVVPVPMLGKVR